MNDEESTVHRARNTKHEFMERFRTYRINQQERDSHAEVFLRVEDFIYPVFVVEGVGMANEISSLRDVFQYSIDKLLEEIGNIVQVGIDKLLLFGVVDKTHKDETGSYGALDNNIVSNAVRAIKKQYPSLIIITDVCLCAYTNHGHCGIVEGEAIDNDKTLPYLAQIALSHARAGADMVAPSAMMDGQVTAIRALLDQQGFREVRILGYSAKYSSSMYGPFRDAAQSAPAFGDRRTYQMDYRTVSQGVGEARADIAEKADWVMVKPAHTYLDMILRIKQQFPSVPLAAYHVSGEYMLIKAAAEAGLVDEHLAMTEVLTAIKRAGADYLISYYAKKIFNQNAR